MNTARQEILLVNVVQDGDYQYPQELPLGLAAVGAYLRREGWPLRFRPCFASRGEAELAAAAADGANVYGFQINMVNGPAVCAVARGVKARRPDAVTVCGGPFLASRAEEILRHEPAIDYVVIGEGEETLAELLDRLRAGGDGAGPDLAGIAGLVWRDAAGVPVRNPYRAAIADLDRLPFPARDFLDEARRDPVDDGLLESVRMASSRGCIGRCTFCCVNLYSRIIGGRRWRGRSPARVVDELETLARTSRARLFNFSDSSFDDPGEPGKARSREICEEILRRGLALSIKIYLRCETLRDDADIELLKLYKRAGIDVIIVGAESGSDEELALYRKRARLEDNRRIIRILRELDCFYVLTGFIMFGPHSTAATLRGNVDYLHEAGLAHNPNLVSNVLMLFRDSQLYAELREAGKLVAGEGGSFWELPRYRIADPVGRRMAGVWENLLSRYPVAAQLNNLQVNLANLIARMTNPMNSKVLEALPGEFGELKARCDDLNRAVGDRLRDHFRAMIDAVEADRDDGELASRMEEFVADGYRRHLPDYQALYDGFLARITRRGFSLSGLLFENFISAMVYQGDKRI